MTAVEMLVIRPLSSKWLWSNNTNKTVILTVLTVYLFLKLTWGVGGIDGGDD